MCRLISMIVCLCAILSLANVAAQEEEADNREAYILDLCERSINELASLQLSLLIEDLDRAIQLEPKTKKRLELAAKGAALRYAEKQMEQDKRVISLQLADHLSPDADNMMLNSEVVDLSQFKIEEQSEELDLANEQGDAETTERVEIYPRISFRLKQKNFGWNFRHKRGSSGYGVSGGFDKVLQTEPWKRTFDQLVSAEQQEQYREFTNARAAETLNKMLLGYLELQLRLTAEQKSKVKDWLKTEIRVDQVDQMGDYGSLFVNTIRSLPQNGLDDILTENQTMLWQQLLRNP